MITYNYQICLPDMVWRLSLTVTVAVDEKLFKIAKELKAKGYFVVSTSSKHKKVDALVYSDSSLIASNDVECAQETGIFLVNGRNKTTEEIDIILKNRCYSPLFDL